ncbi:MAG: DUF3108 domain-containing protein [Acidobacteriota bacterium]
MAAVLAAGTGIGHTQVRPLDEDFRYHWELSNFIGRLASVFLPGQGDGSLAFKIQPNGNLRSELTITSPDSQSGDYFRYGSEVDADTLKPVRAWSSYHWRGETKSKDESVDREGVLDIAAGIYSIRRDPPRATRRIEIWSDGKTYPVEIVPQGVEQRAISGRKVLARHFIIRGVEVDGQRNWKGRLELWLSTDAAARPLGITLSRNLADVRLELKQPLPKDR